MTDGKEVLTTRDHRRDVAGLTYVYPVLSRRAGGVSVGINLNPNNACNWHCVYCQVPGLVRGNAPAIDLPVLEAELRGFLHELLHGDWLERHAPEGARSIRDIAFSGNGEPTSAQDFAQIVERVGAIRAEYGLGAVPLRLITNGSLMGRDSVLQGINALGRLGGEVWFKLDGGRPEDWARVNGVNLNEAQVVRHLQACAARCDTWLQSCFFRWDGEGASAAAIDAYLSIIDAAGPGCLKGVHLYGVARPSRQDEAPRVSPLDPEALQAIAERLKKKGLTVNVSP